MPTEVLSYYLKNKDRKVRLGFQVILQCAPFLKGLKVSGLISMENESYSELEEMFSGMEINFYKLSCSEGKCLVLFYRPKELEEYMNQPKLRELIGQYGYKESNIEEMLAHLSERIRECTAKGIGSVSYTHLDVYKRQLVEEGIDEADAFVALTGMDEENIILSLFAKSQNVDKIVTKVNEDRRARMVEDFGIDSIVSVKTATADAIMSYVRARKNSQGSANVETMYQLVDDKVEALEFIVKAETNYTGIPLKNLCLLYTSLQIMVCFQRKIR